MTTIRILPVALALGAALGVSCSRNQIPTPTRVLDRPSDAALFCVDYDFFHPGRPGPDGGAFVSCPLPQVPPVPAVLDDKATQALQNFIDAFCNTDTSTTDGPAARLLPLEECDSQHRLGQPLDGQGQVGRLLDLRRVAQALGRSPDAPCCPADTPNCGVYPPACLRRKLEALVTNTNRGEVAVVDTQTQVSGLNTIGDIANLQDRRPGYGLLPVGLLPQHIRARGDLAVTANAGSCDLSVIDLTAVTKLIAQPRGCQPATGDGPSSCPVTVTPKIQGQPLGLRPSWLEILPWTVGSARRALVAFPSCGLVADVDLASGELKEGVLFGGGDARLLKDTKDFLALRCPADCGSGAAATEVPDGGAGGARSLPASFAIDELGRRILIGDELGDKLTLLSYDPDVGDGQHFSAPRQRPLDFSGPPIHPRSGERGIDVVRAGPRTGAGHFAYLVARDATVHVFNLDTESECETNPDPRYLQELAIQGPGRVLPDEEMEQNLRRFSCLPVGATPRSPQAYSPGIALPDGSLPRDVAFVHSDIPCDPADPECPYAPVVDQNNNVPFVSASPDNWVGDFAWILGSSGVTQAVQIADYCPQPSYRACFPEAAAKWRAALLMTRSQGEPSPETDDATRGLPVLIQPITVNPLDRLSNVRRAGAGPQNLLPTTATPAPPFSRFDYQRNPGPGVGTDNLGQLYTARVNNTTILLTTQVLDENNQQSMRQVAPAPQTVSYLPVDPVCDVALRDYGAALQNGQPSYRPQTIAAFPDISAAHDENWSLQWEGALPDLSRSTGLLLSDMEGGAAHARLVDNGGLYCVRGVEPGDKVWLPGCYQDQDCPSPLTCAREPSRGANAGICVQGLGAQNRCQQLSQLLTVDHPLPDTRGTVWAASITWRYRVLKAEQQQVVHYMIGATPVRDVADRLTLGEIAEPEYPLEQARCREADLGSACPDDRAAVHVQLLGQDVPVARSTTCRADLDDQGKKTYRCVLECRTSDDCGVGFVCAHSAYEALEGGLGTHKPRCLRAPLLAAGLTPVSVDGGKSVSILDDNLGGQLMAACFPKQVSYQVRGGSAFLARGDVSRAPVLEKVVAGECQRPPADDPLFPAARLRQPRLRLGPRHLEESDAALPGCPTPGQFISHRLPAPAMEAESCAQLRSKGLSLVRADGTPVPGTTDNVPSKPLAVVPGSAVLDPWVRRELDLFGSVPRSQPGACILAGTDEALGHGSQSCVDGSRDRPCCADGTDPPCARRVHYENLVFNLVMEVPRNPLPLDFGGGRKLWWKEWVVPQEGYVINFVVRGGYRPYMLQATASRGQQAQGLRSAVTAPDGAVFVVDEGRSGAPTGLRGQLMRIYRGAFDQSFLVR